MKKAVIFAVIFLCSLFSVNALVEDSTNYITFHEEPVNLSFFVENDSGNTQDLEVKVFSPIAYELNGKKSVLEEGEKTLIEITFFPKKEFIDSIWDATIEVRLGKEISRKEIEMKFYKRYFSPVEFSAKQKENRIEITAVNTSSIATEFEILGLKNESNWKIVKESFSLEAGEEKKFYSNLSGNGNEKNFVLILCDGFTEEIKVELKTSEINWNTVTGQFALGGLGEVLEPINIGLIIIAAVLLIVFISRFVKRLKGEEK